MTFELGVLLPRWDTMHIDYLVILEPAMIVPLSNATAKNAVAFWSSDRLDAAVMTAMAALAAVSMTELLAAATAEAALLITADPW